MLLLNLIFTKVSQRCAQKEVGVLSTDVGINENLTCSQKMLGMGTLEGNILAYSL